MNLLTYSLLHVPVVLKNNLTTIIAPIPSRCGLKVVMALLCLFELNENNNPKARMMNKYDRKMGNHLKQQLTP